MGAMKTVVVTGAGGFLGRHVTAALATTWKIVPVVSRSGGRKGAIALDLTAPDAAKQLTDKLAGRKTDAVIHLASVMCTPENSRDWRLLTGNMAMARAVTEACRIIKPAVLVHASSIAVYPCRDGLYREDSPVDMSGNGDALYGLAKFNAEMMFNFYLDSVTKVVNLRIAQVYGPGMRPDRILPALKSEWRKAGTLTVFGNGERVVNFIHVEDVVRTIAAVLKKPKAGTYNVAHARNDNLRSVARAMIRECGAGKIVTVGKGSRARQRISADRLKHDYNLVLTRQNFHGIGGAS